jgi:hypothetical protein
MKIILLGIWLTYGADASTTTYGINKRLVREALIPSQNVYVIDGVTSGEAYLTSKGLLKLNVKHPVAAKLIGIGMIAARSFVVSSNLNQLRKH